jgi:hypothetical protein
MDDGVELDVGDAEAASERRGEPRLPGSGIAPTDTRSTRGSCPLSPACVHTGRGLQRPQPAPQGCGRGEGTHRTAAASRDPGTRPKSGVSPWPHDENGNTMRSHLRNDRRWERNNQGGVRRALTVLILVARDGSTYSSPASRE